MKTKHLIKTILSLFLFTLCAQAWAEEVTYTVTSKTAVSTSGTAPAGSSVSFVNTYNAANTMYAQMTSGNSMTLTLSGFKGKIIRGITLSMKSNQSAGAGYLSVKAGSTTIASIGSTNSGVNFNNAAWNGTYVTTYTDVSPAMSNSSYIIQDGEDVVIVIGATVNSLYCQSFKISYENDSSDSSPLIDASWSVEPTTVSVTIGKTAIATITTDYDGSMSVYSNAESTATATIEGNVITVTGISKGTTTLRITGDATSTYKAITKELEVNVTRHENEIFYESFDTNNGTGGNDNRWSGSIASSAIQFDNSGWNVINSAGASKCIKVGTTNAQGFVETPQLGLACNATLFFKAAAWNSNDEKTTLKLTVKGGGSISPETVSLVKGAWSDYEVTLTGLTAESKIRFEGEKANNNRFFLDEVSIVKQVVSYTPAGTIAFAADGGENNYYATFCSKEIIAIPTDPSDEVKIDVQAVSVNADGTLTMKNFVDDYHCTNEEKDKVIIPANTGVLIHALTTVDTAPIINIETTNAESATSKYESNFNMLRAGSVAKETDGSYKFYKLAYSDSSHTPSTLGFYWGASGGAAFSSNEKLAYLAVPVTTIQAAPKGFRFINDEATEIYNLKNTLAANKVYNLNGQEVNAIYKGFVIVNGKKVLRK